METVEASEVRGRQQRVLAVALVANGILVGAEFAGGVAFGSLALLADAAHAFSDVAGIMVALVAQSLIGRPRSARHSYGFQRTEVLGAQANGVILVATSAWIVFEAVRRLGTPHAVEGGGLVAVATVGLAVNIVSAVLIRREQGHSLNMRGAFVHMAADAAGSLAAVVAGVAVLVWDAEWADPAISIGIAALVLVSAWTLLRDTTHVLLEGTPKRLDFEEVAAVIASAPGVTDVHHLHLWSLASDTPALSAHVVVGEDVTMHEAQQRGAVVRAALAEQFGIEHVTLELECHTCEPENLRQ